MGADVYATTTIPMGECLVVVDGDTVSPEAMAAAIPLETVIAFPTRIFPALPVRVRMLDMVMGTSERMQTKLFQELRLSSILFGHTASQPPCLLTNVDHLLDKSRLQTLSTVASRVLDTNCSIAEFPFVTAFTLWWKLLDGIDDEARITLRAFSEVITTEDDEQ